MTAPDLGVFLPTMSGSGETPGDIAAAARHAEDLGIESVWSVDQLVGGAGMPMVDSVVALATAAGATSRVLLGFGVMILPLRPAVWVAKQVASLQHVSGGRVLLGVGAGGDRHERSWAAAGVPRNERGPRTDAALRVLPGLIAGEPTELDEGTTVQLAPPAPVPPIVVGGMSGPAMRRAVDADGWFLLPVPPAAVAEARAGMAARAAAAGRPVPALTVGLMPLLAGDSAVPDEDALLHRLTDPSGQFGMPVEAATDVLVRGKPADLAAHLAALGDAGAQRVVATFAAGDWFRQSELLAEARALLT